MAELNDLHLDEIPDDEDIFIPVSLEEYLYLRKTRDFVDQLHKILSRRGALKDSSWDINYLNVSISQPAEAVAEILAALEALLPGKFLSLEASIATGNNFKYQFFTKRHEDRKKAEREALTKKKEEETEGDEE